MTRDEGGVRYTVTLHTIERVERLDYMFVDKDINVFKSSLAYLNISVIII